MDLNSKEAREMDFELIDGEYKDLIVEMLSAKSKQINGKPSITYKLGRLKGDCDGDVIFATYYLTDAAAWKMRQFAIACNLFTLEKDYDGKEFKKIIDGFTPGHCIGKRLIVDTEIVEYNGRKETKVKNERRVKAVEPMVSDDF